VCGEPTPWRLGSTSSDYVERFHRNIRSVVRACAALACRKPMAWVTLTGTHFRMGSADRIVRGPFTQNSRHMVRMRVHISIRRTCHRGIRWRRTHYVTDFLSPRVALIKPTEPCALHYLTRAYNQLGHRLMQLGSGAAAGTNWR
jgi:hypothetical protein